jgi:hypothetical protein
MFIRLPAQKYVTGKIASEVRFNRYLTFSVYNCLTFNGIAE